MSSRRDRYILSPTVDLKYALKAKMTNVDQVSRHKANALGLPSHGLFPTSDYQENTSCILSKQQLENTGKLRLEEINSTPIGILDCPDLRDDFYLNVLDWSANNIVTIALDNSVYCYFYESKESECLASTAEFQYISSLRSMKAGHLMVIANSTGCISILDVSTKKELARGMLPSESRVAAMACKDNSGTFDDHLLLAGSKTGNIYGYDVRRKLKTSTICLSGHDLEVSGLQMAQDSWQVSSGGNDNRVIVWDLRKERPLFVQNEYNSAVKALAWCPWQRHLLVVGTGTNDRRVCVWNTSTNSLMYNSPTDSQVCGIMWAPLVSEIITAHGYAGNDLCLWRYPSLDKISSIKAHESRILHSAISPDGTTVATCAANESLKFWELYRKRPQLRTPVPDRFKI